MSAYDWYGREAFREVRLDLVEQTGAEALKASPEDQDHASNVFEARQRRALLKVRDPRLAQSKQVGAICLGQT